VVVVDERMSIGELADAAAVSRRAVRFYVQRGLLPAPHGLGRGRHYDAGHLERLRRIGELQATGHALEAIKRLLDGRPSPAPEPPTALPALPASPASPASPAAPGPRRPVLEAQLWTRLNIADGVELHVDAGRRELTVEELLAVRDAVRSILGREPANRDNEEPVEESPPRARIPRRGEKETP
jgi:DNA-binding transcriptional MerR regulator